jgi:YggT family protein
MEPILQLVDLVITFLMVAIVGRAILSFVIPMAGARPHPILLNVNYVVNLVTEPLIGPIRRVLPTIGALDFSPLLAIIILSVIKRAVGAG